MSCRSKIIGLHENLKGSVTPLQKRFLQILSFNGYQVSQTNCNRSDFWETVSDLNYFIYNWDYPDSEHQIAESILPVIESMDGIRCFPDWRTRWHYNDKIKQIYLLKAHGFPIIDSWIFWDQSIAEKWLRKASYPLVFKLKGGAGSANVVLLHSYKDALEVTRKIFSKTGIESGKIPLTSNLYYFRDRLQLWAFRKWIAEKRGRLGPPGPFPYWRRFRDFVLFQRFLPNNDYDTRITVIGSRAFCFTRQNRRKDFRASGSGNINYDVGLVEKEMVEIAFNVSRTFEFQSMAYDFLKDEKGKPQIVEMSYTFQDIPVYKCPGFYDSSLKWHEGNHWPQYFILQDLLKDASLAQPNLNSY